jgi:hypothetical protein
MATLPEKPYAEAVCGAILKNEPLLGAMLAVDMKGMGNDVKRFFAYARDSYTLGLPAGMTQVTGTANISAVEAAIIDNLDITDPIDVIGSSYIVATPEVAAYFWLEANRDYDKTTNEVGIRPVGMTWVYNHTEEQDEAYYPKKVKYLTSRLSEDGLSLIITYSGYIVFSMIEYEGGQQNGDAESHIVLVEVANNTFEETISLPWLADVAWGQEYLVAYYVRYTGTPPVASDVLNWFYQLGTNVYPAIEPGITPQTTSGNYLPVVPIRYLNKDMTREEVRETPLYITSKKLLKKLELDIDAIAEKINTHPDVAKFDHAYIMFGVDLALESRTNNIYLHMYFERMSEFEVTHEAEFLSKVGQPAYTDYGREPVNAYRAAAGTSQDFTEHGLDLTIKWDYIKIYIETGQLPDIAIGDVKREIVPYTIDVTTLSGYDPESGVPLYSTVQVDKCYLKLQMQTTTNTIKTIDVYGLEINNMIYKGHGVDTSLLDVYNNPDEHNLIIPVHYELAQTMIGKERNEFYTNSLLMIINSYESTGTKWYQNSAFIGIVKGAVFLVSCYFFFTSSWLFMLVQLLSAGFYAAAAAMIVIGLAAMYALSAVLDYLTDWIIKTFGTTIGLFIAAIVAIVAAFSGQFGNFFGTLGEFVCVTAQDLLQISQAIISSANEFLLEEAASIEGHYYAFQATLAEHVTELAKITDLLYEHKVNLNPLMWTAPAKFQVVRNESPTDFFNRNLNLVDNTMSTIHNQIPSFISSRLALPKGPAVFLT